MEDGRDEEGECEVVDCLEGDDLGYDEEWVPALDAAHGEGEGGRRRRRKKEEGRRRGNGDESIISSCSFLPCFGFCIRRSLAYSISSSQLKARQLCYPAFTIPSSVDMETNPFIIDHDSQDGDHDKPHLSDSDSDVDESALHRDYFEKDSRFLDEPALEEGHGRDGNDEAEGYTYPPMSKRTRTRQPKLFIFILFCILLAAAAVGILAGHGFKPASTTYSRKGGSKHLTMDHIFNGTFQPHLENIAWVKEGRFVDALSALAFFADRLDS